MRPRTIGLVAPSGFLPDPLVIDRAARFFSAAGWHVVAGESVFARDQRFAGPDALRLGELQRFATDPSIDVVLSARGGYGLSRLLAQIDYAAIRARKAPLVGYSDFTAFSLALLARGGVSFCGPSAGDFGAERPDSFTVEHFFGVLDTPSYAVDLALDGPTRTIEGRLWGGNLAMLTALVGTPYLPRVRDGLLFVEDVNEPAYKIERMFLQLLHAGVLQKQAALLLGDFDPITPMPNDNGFGLAAVIERLRQVSGVPVYAGLPFGHVPRKLTLPVGGRARLTVRRGGRATLALSGYPMARAGAARPPHPVRHPTGASTAPQ
jgi:muramoyltetrapeptide carboxypeptidase